MERLRSPCRKNEWKSAGTAGPVFSTMFSNMSFRALSFGWAAVVLALCIPAGLCADEVGVRFTEGVRRGFLVVTTDDGRKIAQGDSQQVAHGYRVTNHLTLHFSDGSVFEDEIVFTQNGRFHLLSDHVTQMGPSFKNPMETIVDTAKGQVTVHYTDDKGQQKTTVKHMDLPADVANGLLFVLVKDINPRSPTTLSYVAATAEPRLVKPVFKPQGPSIFIVGDTKLQADHYLVSVDIGGIPGAVAPLVRKKPADSEIWAIGGRRPRSRDFGARFTWVAPSGTLT